MEIGIAYDLRSDFEAAADGPEDALEEYDSAATVDAIAEALAACGYRARKLGGGRAFLEAALKPSPPALVFNIAEGRGTRSREAHVPAALEMLGIPFTHSDPLTLALTLDKAMAKRVAASYGVPTPRFAVVQPGEPVGDPGLAFPVIAKPLFEGSSVGVRNASKLHDLAALRAWVERLIADYGEAVLVEEFCAGPEFTVGVLGTGAEAAAIGVMEIAPRRGPAEDFVYSLEVKRNYLEEVDYHVPPRRPESVVRAVEAVALAAHRALGCRDVSRVDVRLDAAGEPKFLEVNPLPGLNPVTGDIVILSGKAGLAYPDLIGAIVARARRRLRL